MENKIIYVSQETIHSKKRNQDFYIIYYIMNRKPVTEFVTEEVYKKIKIKNLQELKEYTAIFNINMSGVGKQVLLFDIK